MEAGAFQGSPSPRNTPPSPLTPNKVVVEAMAGGGAWAVWRRSLGGSRPSLGCVGGRSLGGVGGGEEPGWRGAGPHRGRPVCGGGRVRRGGGAGRRPAMIASCLCYLLLPAARLFRSLSGTGLASRGAGSWGCALWRRRRGGGSAGPWGGGSGRASHPLAARCGGGGSLSPGPRAVLAPRGSGWPATLVGSPSSRCGLVTSGHG